MICYHQCLTSKDQYIGSCGFICGVESANSLIPSKCQFVSFERYGYQQSYTFSVSKTINNGQDFQRKLFPFLWPICIAEILCIYAINLYFFISLYLYILNLTFQKFANLFQVCTWIYIWRIIDTLSWICTNLGIMRTSMISTIFSLLRLL